MPLHLDDDFVDAPLITRRWREALEGIDIFYPALGRDVEVRLNSAGIFTLCLEGHINNLDGRPFRRRFIAGQTLLYFFPGTFLARAFVAAAFAGYLQHEALELVSFHGVRALDPHEEPYPSAPWNRGLREGLPRQLTPETLVTSLAVIMPLHVAEKLVADRAAEFVNGPSDTEDPA